AGRGAQRVGKRLRGWNERRLLDVPLWHRPIAAREILAKLPLELWIKLQRLADRLRDRLARQVVLGRSQATGHDDDLAALQGAAEDLDDTRLGVAYLADPEHVDADRRQLLVQILGILIRDHAEQQLGADRNN